MAMPQVAEKGALNSPSYRINNLEIAIAMRIVTHAQLSLNLALRGLSDTENFAIANIGA